VRLHLIDGTYELFRAHYSPRPGHAGPSGQDLKATVGVVASLLSLLHDQTEDVTHIAVAFDNPIRSFRNDLYPFYKSDEGVEPALRAQFDTVEEAVRALGVAVWSMRDHEADDGMASGAARFRDQVDQVRIMTPDKDLGQCIRGTRVVQVDRRQMKQTDEAAFRERRGFAPASMADYLALTGDSADGFPGLPGFGEKTAGALIGAYGRLEDIPEMARDWTVKVRGAPQLAATLAARRDEAVLYRKLATLVEDAPVATSLDDVAFRGVPRETFEAWCESVASTTLPGVPKRWRE
jgi:5'-3' exonuclease